MARLTEDERGRLARFRAMGVVRSMGAESLRLRPRYPADLPLWKRPPDGVVEVGVLIVQPTVTPLVELLKHKLRAGNIDAVREWEQRYAACVHDLWRHGVSHLDFSILNVGVAHSADGDSLVLFDPHLGVIEVSPAGVEVRDPLARRPEEQRSLDELLRAAREAARWALWRIQEMAAASPDIPREAAAAAADVAAPRPRTHPPTPARSPHPESGRSQGHRATPTPSTSASDPRRPPPHTHRAGTAA